MPYHEKTYSEEIGMGRGKSSSDWMTMFDVMKLTCK